MQPRASMHRRMIGMATALLIAATFVAIAGPVIVSAYFDTPASAGTAHHHR
jgi:hypothetical protein